ncbi:MAG: 4Fe-4S binding protein, partial [Eubacteriales bacterium]|nr:4Fe-4S binding protein [Eubacteriales bacterium]
KDNTIYNTELWSEYPVGRWSDQILPELKKVISKPLIVSVGYTASDMAVVVPKVNAFADFFEVSTHYGMDELGHLVDKICSLTDKPVFVKLSPHIQDYIAFVEKAVEHGAKGVVAINSLGPGMIVDLKSKSVTIGVDGGKSWISGPSIKPIALHRVANIRKAFQDLPIIACGGVEKAEDVLEFILAGADLVQMLSSSMIKGRDLFDKIVIDLPVLMARYGIDSIEELRNTTLNTTPIGKGGYPSVDDNICTMCRLCVRICPEMALSLDSNIQLDRERCICCGLCQSRCPVGAISGVI